MSLLVAEDLTVVPAADAPPAVDRLSFAIERGEAVGLVGESGAGKTQAALALMGLTAPGARVTGSVRFAGEELLGAAEPLLNRYRGRRMAMIFQDPLQALNPYLTVGEQLKRVLLEHRAVAARAVAGRGAELLARAGLPDPGRVARSYPHQLSGGMRQRAMIALALALDPELLIADEPTTALDVTVQAGILALLAAERARLGLALLLITHDLGVIAENCERMLVLSGGRLVEEGRTTAVFTRPRHAVTRTLLAVAPGIDALPPPAPPPATERVLEVEQLAVRFRAPGRRQGPVIPAVVNLCLGVGRGETLAVVGESGAGKTTLARALLGLVTPAAGRILYRGRPLAGRVEARRPAEHRALQMVFQDPVSSLNPALRIGELLAEVVGLHEPRLSAAGRAARAGELLALVGLPAGIAGRRPHELSGGQAQRAAIARALAPRPELLVCDEAVAALDGQVRAGILDLLARLQQEEDLALLFITHDLGVVRRIAHRVLVMYRGRTCETAATEALFRHPRHPYTRSLLASLPVADPARYGRTRPPAVAAEPAAQTSTGCPFQPRCAWAEPRCAAEYPPAVRFAAGEAACHRAAELDLREPRPGEKPPRLPENPANR